jgi:hypothetical protein
MTDGRPPKDETSNADPDATDDPAVGNRSQTRPVSSGRTTPVGMAPAPRSTFSADSEKIVKRPIPGE